MRRSCSKARSMRASRSRRASSRNIGMYEDYGPGFRATFSALTHATDAIYQAIEPGYHREHIYLGALPIAASLRSAISAVVPNVRDVAVTEAGAGRTDN